MKKKDIENVVEDVLIEMGTLDDEEIVEAAKEISDRLSEKFSNDIED